MNRIIVFSDIHVHNYKRFSTTDVEIGLNSRMLQAIDALTQIRCYAEEKNIKHVLFCGDLLHDGSSIPCDILEALKFELERFGFLGFKMYLISGQHDYKGKDKRYNAVKAIAGDGPLKYLDDTFFYQMDDYVIVPVLYDYSIDKLRERLRKIREELEEYKGYKKILVGHFLVKEVLEADGLSLDLDVISHSELPSGIHAYLIGDYHHRVWLPDLKLLSVGEVIHHDFSSKTEGFIDMDLDTLEFEVIPTNAPKFLTFQAKDFKPKKLDKKDFYRIIVKEQREVDNIIAKTGGEWMIEFQYEEEKPKEEDDERLVVTKESPVDVVREYARYHVVSKETLQKGEEIISSLEGE